MNFDINEGQIIISYPTDGAMGSSGGGLLREFSVVCLHNNAIVAKGILVTILHCGTPESRISAVYIVSSVGILLLFYVNIIFVVIYNNNFYSNIRLKVLVHKVGSENSFL